MIGITPKPDAELSPEQEALVARLSAAEIDEIDRALLSQVATRWQKVAKVVGSTMLQFPQLAPQLPDVFFAQRITKLVQDGALELRGAEGYMGFSEVRLINIGRE